MKFIYLNTGSETIGHCSTESVMTPKTQGFSFWRQESGSLLIQEYNLFALPQLPMQTPIKEKR